MNTTNASSPAADTRQLDAWLDALQLDADAAQRQRLLDYLALLQRWNRVYNLTAVRDPEQMLAKHLADCLALIAPLRALAPARLLDVGSGGGLPGLVVAILLPATEVVLCDAVRKKCAFLQQAAATLGLRNVRVEHGRIEALALPPFDCITSRAFSGLAEMLRLTRHLLRPGGCWAAMKGVRPDAELAALPDDVHAEVQPLAVPGLDAQRCVVWLRPIEPKP
ncbi:ribosomal RNA small subunit methyltransferase G [mine drainage metagenome]|uniref:Ribosomal RNA small subunit methyltransferase G n=1 Tax=mine drainage metagenome TaxID=410659 RepID=A0A1J5R0D6_9ZZZZ